MPGCNCDFWRKGIPGYRWAHVTYRVTHSDTPTTRAHPLCRHRHTDVYYPHARLVHTHTHTAQTDTVRKERWLQTGRKPRGDCEWDRAHFRVLLIWLVLFKMWAPVFCGGRHPTHVNTQVICLHAEVTKTSRYSSWQRQPLAHCCCPPPLFPFTPFLLLLSNSKKWTQASVPVLSSGRAFRDTQMGIETWSWQR